VCVCEYGLALNAQLNSMDSSFVLFIIFVIKVFAPLDCTDGEIGFAEVGIFCIFFIQKGS